MFDFLIRKSASHHNSEKLAEKWFYYSWLGFLIFGMMWNTKNLNLHVAGYMSTRKSYTWKMMQKSFETLTAGFELKSVSADSLYKIWIGLEFVWRSKFNFFADDGTNRKENHNFPGNQFRSFSLRKSNWVQRTLLNYEVKTFRKRFLGKLWRLGKKFGFSENLVPRFHPIYF